VFAQQFHGLLFDFSAGCRSAQAAEHCISTTNALEVMRDATGSQMDFSLGTGLLGSGLQSMSPAVEPLQAVAGHISRVGLARGRSDHHAVTSSWTLQESQVESCEHQDNSYIHH
jgi:hypothetical protein